MKYRILAMTNCMPGQDAEFNRWYDERHLHDVLAVPGVVSAQRFKTSDGFDSPLSYRYITLYELNTDDPGAVLQELGKRIGTNVMPASPSLDMSSAGVLILEAVGESVTASPKKVSEGVA